MVAMELATSSRLHSPPGHSSTPRQPPLAARQHPVPQPRHLARPITPSQSARKPVPRPAATAARASTSPDTRPARPRSLSQSATTDSKVLERAGSQESFRRKRGATNDPPNIDATPTAPLPFPTSSSHLSLVPGRARPKSPRLESRAVSSSSCPEPRGATVSTGGGPSRIAAVSKIMAEGELGPAGQRKAGEVLVELRDGRSVSSSECGGDDDDDDDVPVFTDHLTPYVFDCTMPVSIPDPPPSHSLPSPRNSPPHRSPLLRPSPLRIHSSPTRLPFATAFEDTLAGVQHTNASSNSTLPVPADPMAASPTPSQSSFALDRSASSPAEHRTRDSSASSSLSKDEKRRRRGSADPVAKVVHAQRPPLHTYTSFEATFDLHPPPSPPPSPKAETKSWWGLGA